MKFETIKNVLETRKNGTFTSIQYKSEVPVSAKMKNNYRVVKTTNSVVRFGCKYDNLSKVIAKRSAPNYIPAAPRVNNNEWIVENKISRNTNTGNTSLRCYTVNNHSNSKSIYKVYDSTGKVVMTTFSKDTLKSWSEENNNAVLPSYFMRAYEDNGMFTVNIDNVVSINGVK